MEGWETFLCNYCTVYLGCIPISGEEGIYVTKMIELTYVDYVAVTGGTSILMRMFYCHWNCSFFVEFFIQFRSLNYTFERQIRNLPLIRHGGSFLPRWAIKLLLDTRELLWLKAVFICYRLVLVQSNYNDASFFSKTQITFLAPNHTITTQVNVKYVISSWFEYRFLLTLSNKWVLRNFLALNY